MASVTVLKDYFKGRGRKVPASDVSFVQDVKFYNGAWMSTRSHPFLLGEMQGRLTNDDAVARHVIGFSLGTLAARKHAADTTALDSLVLVAPPYDGMRLGLGFLSGTSLMGTSPLGAKFERENPAMANRFKDHMVTNWSFNPMGGFGSIMHEFATFWAGHVHPRIGCRTLVVAGDRDGIVPLDHAMAVAREIPGARMLISQGSGHVPMLEDRSVLASMHAFQQGDDSIGERVQ